MDSLALLCNLHGDGPATLAGLRELGCFELSEVVALPPASIAQLFEGNERIAKRFGREAVLLADRLGELPGLASQNLDSPSHSESSPAESTYDSIEEVSPGPDIEEFTPGPETSAPEVLTPFPALSKGGPESAARLGIEPLPAPELPEETPAFQAEGANAPVVKAVLDLWNRLDGRAAQPASPPSSGLAHAGLKGLSEELAGKLAKAGVESLGALLEANVLDLSSATGIPYTKLAHLQFLGRKLLTQEQPGELTPFERPDEAVPESKAPQGTPAAETPERATSNVSEPLVDDGPAGPFA
ncbi:MAG: helix-hairpin-helix domain-containing protein [Planctomycetota bacterium]|nr:helix-hairpin-helix domain-containing protein [Planctomycetota bacterium]MDG2143894.1 helix-hairpin-helix domain-containing protein [Planctomycetota bacterium]